MGDILRQGIGGVSAVGSADDVHPVFIYPELAADPSPDLHNTGISRIAAPGEAPAGDVEAQASLGQIFFIQLVAIGSFILRRQDQQRRISLGRIVIRRQVSSERTMRLSKTERI